MSLTHSVQCFPWERQCHSSVRPMCRIWWRRPSRKELRWEFGSRVEEFWLRLTLSEPGQDGPGSWLSKLSAVEVLPEFEVLLLLLRQLWLPQQFSLCPRILWISGKLLPGNLHDLTKRGSWNISLSTYTYNMAHKRQWNGSQARKASLRKPGFDPNWRLPTFCLPTQPGHLLFVIKAAHLLQHCNNRRSLKMQNYR